MSLDNIRKSHAKVSQNFRSLDHHAKREGTTLDYDDYGRRIRRPNAAIYVKGVRLA